MSKVVVPVDPKLSEIVEGIRQHQVDFPHHSIACGCLDDLVETVRAALSVGTTQELIDDDDRWAIQSRIEYVFILANRRYP